MQGQTGVFWCPPRGCCGHTYKETVVLGTAALSQVPHTHSHRVCATLIRLTLIYLTLIYLTLIYLTLIRVTLIYLTLIRVTLIYVTLIYLTLIYLTLIRVYSRIAHPVSSGVLDHVECPCA